MKKLLIKIKLFYYKLLLKRKTILIDKYNKEITKI